jgi:hypothetical protein
MATILDGSQMFYFKNDFSDANRPVLSDETVHPLSQHLGI